MLLDHILGWTVGITLIVLGICHLAVSTRVLTIYERLNRNRGPWTFLWIGQSLESVRAGGVLMIGVGLLAIYGLGILG